MRVVGAAAEQGGGGLEEGGNEKVMRKSENGIEKVAKQLPI